MRGHNDGLVFIDKVKIDGKDEFADIHILRDQKEESSEEPPELTGIARMITYKLNGDKKEMISIIEGEMVKGMIDGFARNLFVSRDNVTHCQVGYWKPLPDQARLVPYGKWTWFTTKDNIET